MIGIGVLISGGGSNLQAIMDACKSGILKGKAVVSIVISNRQDAFGLERARKNGIRSVFLNRKDFESAAAFCEEIKRMLLQNNVNLVCLAGFLSKLEPNVIKRFKIINMHPALLPKYGGQGMYGHYVHEAVLKSGEKESGATVHWVDEHYDHGDIILQEKIPVAADDTPNTLAARVLEVEHKIYPEAILKVINGLNAKC